MNSPSQEAATLSQKYQKKTDKQHILDNPDTYIGSVENVDSDMWVFGADLGNFSTLRFEKFIFGSGDASTKNVKLFLKTWREHFYFFQYIVVFLTRKHVVVYITSLLKYVLVLQ